MVELRLGEAHMQIRSSDDKPRKLFDLESKIQHSRQIKSERPSYFVKTRADIRPNDKLDALDLRLHEHDAKMFVL